MDEHEQRAWTPCIPLPTIIVEEVEDATLETDALSERAVDLDPGHDGNLTSGGGTARGRIVADRRDLQGRLVCL